MPAFGYSITFSSTTKELVGELTVYFQDVFKNLDILFSEVRKVEEKKWGGTIYPVVNSCFCAV